MNKLNRKVEYALMALKFMSQKNAGQLSSVKEICESTGVPFDATARVMQIMAQAEWLKSEQGVHGGYLIIKDLSKVNFHDLIEMISGPVGIVKCLHGTDHCELKTTCNMQSPLNNLNAQITGFYKTLSLLDLLQVKEKREQRVQ